MIAASRLGSTRDSSAAARIAAAWLSTRCTCDLDRTSSAAETSARAAMRQPNQTNAKSAAAQAARFSQRERPRRAELRPRGAVARLVLERATRSPCPAADLLLQRLDRAVELG